jgi:hypothetical protein
MRDFEKGLIFPYFTVPQPIFQQQIPQTIGSLITNAGSSSNQQYHQSQSISNSMNLTSIPVTIISGSNNDTHTSTVQIHIQQQHTDQQIVF